MGLNWNWFYVHVYLLGNVESRVNWKWTPTISQRFCIRVINFFALTNQHFQLTRFHVWKFISIRFIFFSFNSEKSFKLKMGIRIDHDWNWYIPLLLLVYEPKILKISYWTQFCSVWIRENSLILMCIYVTPCRWARSGKNQMQKIWSIQKKTEETSGWRWKIYL
jgi:hypothetical protein